MKFKAPLNLISRIIKGVSGALQKSNVGTDMCQYIILNVTETEISVQVARQDFLAKNTIDLTKIPGIIQVMETGRCVVFGQKLDMALSPEMNNIMEVVVETLPTPPSKKRAKADDEASENETLKALSVGTFRIKYPGHKGEEIFIDTENFDMPLDPKISVDASVRVGVRCSEFSKYVDQVGLAAGKASMNQNFANVLVKVRGETMEMVTSDGQRLALAEFPVESSTRNTQFIVPHDVLKIVTKMCQDDTNISIYPTTGPNQVVFSQEMDYGTAESAIRSAYRLTQSAEEFIDYDAPLKGLDFKTTFKMKRQQLKEECDKRLGLVEKARSYLIMDPEKGLLYIAKRDDHAKIKTVIPIFDITGSKAEFEVSSRHLSDMMDKCDQEDVELKLSGEKSLALMILSPNLKTYFQPFVEPE